jgi:hypothetical protein
MIVAAAAAYDGDDDNNNIQGRCHHIAVHESPDGE